MKLLLTAAAVVLFAGMANAEQTTYSKITTSNEPISDIVDRGPQPYDFGNINQSPIRGKGAIKVVHNEPVPGDPEADLHKAKWLLQDAGYQCSIPSQRMSRR